jgi:hypothetical protein
MIENATVSIYVPVAAQNGEGDPIKTWGYKKTPTPDAPAESIRCDVQPKSLTEAECLAWGISDRNANAKLVFFSRSVYIAINNRMKVVSDFPGEGAEYYEIKGVNRWAIHGEAVIVPVQGE